MKAVLTIPCKISDDDENIYVEIPEIYRGEEFEIIISKI